MDAKKISSTVEFEKAIEDGVSLIDFNAPWCAPCRAQEPIIQRLSEQFEGKALVAEMNIDENQDTAMKLGIRSIPTLAVFKNGEEIQRFVGLQFQDTLFKAIEEVLE
ncbi:MAG: thiol reductase thioredoxin [Desulfobacterales bacterium PC51MH44]|nr:MAG: thiol reductase thioredoxin [Desulfobacterales bacterium PC51MH44]